MIMNTPYTRVKLKSVQYLRGFIGYDFTIAFTPISISGSTIALNVRLERGETKSLDLEILELSSNTTFGPFTHKFKLESRLTESGSDETFPDNALTIFKFSPPSSTAEDLSSKMSPLTLLFRWKIDIMVLRAISAMRVHPTFVS